MMLNTIKIFSRNILQSRYSAIYSRTFLSEAYSCEKAWNARHEFALLKKINARDMYLQLDQALLTKQRVNAVDVDIFANKLTETDAAEELISIIHQFRLSGDAAGILDSTHHAVIRYLYDNNQKNTLIDVLNDRLNYGIFPDYLSYNLIMDGFIKEQDYASAAKIASLLMLQEDSDHPICNALAMYSCHKYLEKPEDWVLPPAPVEDPDEEVQKIRVDYIRNPFFDDHFDLREPMHIVGKTLVFFGKLNNDSLSRTCLLRGYILWQKYDRALNLVQSWIDGAMKEAIYQEALPLIQKELENIPEDKVTDDVKQLKAFVEKLGACELKQGSITEEMEKRLKKAVEENESKDIDTQCQLYEKWETVRLEALEKERERIDKQKRIEQIAAMKEDLEKRERLLTFFEREEEIELKIEKKLQEEEEKYGPQVVIEEDLAENYVPPEILKKTAPKKY